MSRPARAVIPFISRRRALDSDIRYAKLMGADDYITKPYRANTLAAVPGRLHRARYLRAVQWNDDDAEPRQQRRSELRSVKIDLQRIVSPRTAPRSALSYREFCLMKCLAENRDRVVPLTEARACDTRHRHRRTGCRQLDSSADQTVRRKMGYGPGEWGCIRSVRSVGYSIVGCDEQTGVDTMS